MTKLITIAFIFVCYLYYLILVLVSVAHFLPFPPKPCLSGSQSWGRRGHFWNKAPGGSYTTAVLSESQASRGAPSTSLPRLQLSAPLTPISGGCPVGLGEREVAAKLQMFRAQRRLLN